MSDILRLECRLSKSELSAIGSGVNLIRDKFLSASLNSPIEQFAYADLLGLEAELWYSDIKVIPQYEVGNYIADFMVQLYGESFAIECDGREFHEKTLDQSKRDKRKDRFFQLNGIKIFRFTGSEIYLSPSWMDDISDEVYSILDREHEREINRDA